LALPSGACAELAAELLVSLETNPELDLDDVHAQWVGEPDEAHLVDWAGSGGWCFVVV
jgi:hypothetical protein